MAAVWNWNSIVACRARCLPRLSALPRFTAERAATMGRGSWKLLGGRLCLPTGQPAKFLTSVCVCVRACTGSRLRATARSFAKVCEGKRAVEVTGQPERDRPNFRSHDRITSCGGIPNERAARRGGNSVARVESPNLLFPGGGRKFVRLPVIMSPLTSRFFTRACKFLCSRGLRPV